MSKNDVTLTITVNFSGAERKEGEAKYTMTIPDRFLPYMEPGSFDKELHRLLVKARRQYNERNR